MKKLLLLFLLLSINSYAQVNTLLDIPGRLQWDNNNGYCGENALLAIGLYYGNYTSEYVVRNVAGGELLIASNDVAAFDALGYTYDEWDYNQASPQYQNYLVWVKQHLHNKQPVIITVFIKGMTDPDYDHIVPAIGFNATNLNSYNANDQLIYNSNYDSIPFTRTFGSIYDTRSMNNNGATYDYCIPKNYNYGCAITGVKDVQHVLKPVHLKIDSWDEPNISLNEVPKVLHAVITIDSLISGQQYALMKYVSYLNVPSSNFLPQNADSTIYFTASATTQTFYTSFMSDTTVFYRCIPYASTGINKDEKNTISIFPNPNKGTFSLKMNETNFDNTELFVYNALGEKVHQQRIVGVNTVVNLSEIDKGIYFVKTLNGKQINVSKFVIQ